MNRHSLYHLNSLIISLIFCLAIFIPFSMGIIEKDKDISEIEKRILAKYPKTPQKPADIKNFPELFERYYSDHFGLRDLLSRYYKLAKYSIGDSPSEDVTMGKNGWLFLGSIKKNYNKFSDPIGDARNVNLFSQNDLKQIAQHMIKLKSWLNEKDIQYMFVIAPNKHSIYFEQLPDYISKINQYSATDQLIGYLEKNTDILIIDLRSKLISAKEQHQLYSKTDTHWNHYGANIAQYEIMSGVEKLLPGQIQAEMKEIKTQAVIGGGDLASLMGVHIFKEDKPLPVFEQTCSPTKHPFDALTHILKCDDKKLRLNAVIFRDSFFKPLEPYFSRKFRHSTYIWKKLNYPSLIQHIKLEKPDIIIEQWVERHLIPDFYRPELKKL